MYRTLLKTHVHGIGASESEARYDGSCAIDAELLEAAGIREHEPVHICNVTNGERFVTCAVAGERGGGMVSLHGAHACRAAVGDVIVIAAFAHLEEGVLAQPRTKLFSVHEPVRLA